MVLYKKTQRSAKKMPCKPLFLKLVVPLSNLKQIRFLDRELGFPITAVCVYSVS